MSRYGVFVHNPDGDMGDGAIVGPFRSLDKALAKADSIRRAAKRRTDLSYEDGVECIVVWLLPATTSARDIVTHVD